MTESIFMVEKTSTFKITGKDGSVSDMTFYFESCGSYDYKSWIRVPDIINEYLLDHYIKTGKMASLKKIMDSLIKGDRTPMIMEFMDSAKLQNISGPTSYLFREDAMIYEDIDSYYQALFDALYDNGITKNKSLRELSRSTNFIKVCKDNKKYNFVAGPLIGSFSNGNLDMNFFWFAEEIKDGFDKDEHGKKSLEHYYSSILEDNDLPQDIVEAMKARDINVLFYARDTGICDEIIWYHGEFSQENLRVHLFEGDERLTDIEDNTKEVLNMAEQVYALKANTKEPLSKKEITDLASKEKIAKVTEEVSFDSPGGTELKKTGPRKLVTVLFEDNKKYKYYCVFPVLLGDKVYVEGKEANEVGMIVDISDKLPSGTAANYTLNVVRAFGNIKIKETGSNERSDNAEVISLTKEEAKGVWVTNKDVFGHIHITTYKGEETDTLRVPSVIDGKEIDMVGFNGPICFNKYQSVIKKLIIGNGIRYIGPAAFANLTDLESIEIPPSVTYIYPNAFSSRINTPKIRSRSYADFVVDQLGEYKGQFSLEKKSVYYIPHFMSAKLKPKVISLGAIYQPKPNGKTALLIIEDDFSRKSDELNSVIDLIKTGKAEILAIKESKFRAMINNHK